MEYLDHHSTNLSQLWGSLHLKWDFQPKFLGLKHQNMGPITSYNLYQVFFSFWVKFADSTAWCATIPTNPGDQERKATSSGPSRCFSQRQAITTMWSHHLSQMLHGAGIFTYITG